MILCILWLFIKSEESEGIMLKKIPIFYFSRKKRNLYIYTLRYFIVYKIGYVLYTEYLVNVKKKKMHASLEKKIERSDINET